jgi:hypothetical protein
MMCRVLMAAVICWPSLAAVNGCQDSGLCGSICGASLDMHMHHHQERHCSLVVPSMVAQQGSSCHCVGVCCGWACIESAHGKFSCGLCPAAAWLGLGVHHRSTCPQFDSDTAISCCQGSACSWLLLLSGTPYRNTCGVAVITFRGLTKLCRVWAPYVLRLILLLLAILLLCCHRTAKAHRLLCRA